MSEGNSQSTAKRHSNGIVSIRHYPEHDLSATMDSPHPQDTVSLGIPAWYQGQMNPHLEAVGMNSVSPSTTTVTVLRTSTPATIQQTTISASLSPAPSKSPSEFSTSGPVSSWSQDSKIGLGLGVFFATILLLYISGILYVKARLYFERRKVVKSITVDTAKAKAAKQITKAERTPMLESGLAKPFHTEYHRSNVGRDDAARKTSLPKLQ